jgi:hypothetical protein
MSQHFVTANNKTYKYGYDLCMQEYYLIIIGKDGRGKPLVGGTAALEGTASNLLQTFKKRKLLGIIPPDHLQRVACNLPIPQGEFV